MNSRVAFMVGIIELLRRYRIGKATVFFLILVSSLCSCSGIGNERNTLHPAWGKSKKELLAWASSEKTKAERGTLKYSEYWEQFYQRSIELRPDLDDFLYFGAEMVKGSRIFEEGKITKEQFADKNRELTSLLGREETRRSLSCPFAMSDYERVLFTCYRGSLFLEYVDDLRKHLSTAGSQYSINHCALFADSIQCTTQEPPFLY